MTNKVINNLNLPAPKNFLIGYLLNFMLINTENDSVV